MKIYIDPRIIGKDNYEFIVNRFPQIQISSETENSFESEVLIVMPDFFIKEDINRYKNLKWIQLLMAGYDNFDFSILQNKEVIVTNASDIFSKSIAEDVITKILVLNRKVPFFLEEMKTGSWNPIKNIPELTNSVVGILGTGSIGKEIAKRLKSFETKVIGYRRKDALVQYFDEIYSGETGLEYVLKNSDYVVIALPLTKNTINLINSKTLSLMKENALLINVARGKIVDQDALTEVLINKKIRGAGLDVTIPEPLPKSHPLWTLDNTFITPHNASSSPYMRTRITNLILQNIELYLLKKPVLFQVKE
ncbi:MAG: D-2-hydroxyacid dehydrogenase [Firmicutes bacterium]|nr:D-2-hydroxyacid dehydrogenase [Bacillota bacterium]